jgi:hypothetical protein
LVIGPRLQSTLIIALFTVTGKLLLSYLRWDVYHLLQTGFDRQVSKNAKDIEKNAKNPWRQVKILGALRDLAV